MTGVAVGTIAAKHALPYARVLARSVAEQHPDVPCFVLLADETQECFDPAREPYELLRLTDLGIPDLPRFCFAHREHELSYACTPYLLDALLDRGVSRVLFLKQETLVAGRLDPILDRLEGHSILLTPHLLEPLAGGDRTERELNILQSGVFNAGVVGVSETPAARAFLGWWQDRVYHHCRHAVAQGMHYEQRWLDLAPIFFEDVCVDRDPGANIGHWSLPERIAVEPRVLRFSGFDPERPEQVTRYSRRVSMPALGPVAEVFAAYAEALLAAGWREAQRWPYAYGVFDNGVPIPDVAREIYRGLGDGVERFGDPFRTGGGSYFDWLNQPSDGPTRLWRHVYASRPDLQEAFPDIASSGFEAWTAEQGVKEHAIPPVFATR